MLFDSLRRFRSFLVSTRCFAGGQVLALGPRPEKPLQLFEFEACPFCRKVREAISMLDLEVLIYPCPKWGPRFRQAVVSRGGKAQFPYLVDPNFDREMYESDDIVAYLFERYGAGPPPATLRISWLANLSSMLANLRRPAAGAFYRPAHAPARPLRLFSYEACARSRRVRERLCALELSYRLHSAAPGSGRRGVLAGERPGATIPTLIDPNTGYGSSDPGEILEYLDETYLRSAGGSTPGDRA